MLRTWQKLIPSLEKYAPQLVSLPMPGDLSTVNVEEVLRLKPDVVFVTNYAPPAMIDQLSQAGLPVVVISLSKDEEWSRQSSTPLLPTTMSLIRKA